MLTMCAGVGRGLVTTPGSDGFALSLRDGASITITEGTPLSTAATFSSGGPRTGDSALKPDIAAPGEAIVSTLIGSGTGSIALSGTGMATPYVAGTAALAVQAHPRWTPAEIKAAIINSGNPEELADYATRRVGSGLVNATSVVGTLAYATADRDATTLNFGLKQFRTDLVEHRQIHIKNDSASSVTFDVGVIRQQGSPHRVTTSVQQLTVPKRSALTLDVTITVPAVTAGNSDDFRDVAGLITFTPTTPTVNRGISLKVPYYLVPRVSANVSTTLSPFADSPPFAVAAVSNVNSPIAATANLFAWGLHSPNDERGRIDLRAAGAQAFDVSGGRLIVFAINTFEAWSSPASQEFNILIDVSGDGAPDFDLFSIDFGLLTGSSRTGEIVTAIFNINTGALRADFDVVAPTDASTILLAAFASSIGITPENPRFTYTAAAFDLLSTASDSFAASAGFNAFTSAISNAFFLTVPPNETRFFPISVNPTEFALTPAKGLMVITPDDQSGTAEADLVGVAFE